VQPGDPRADPTVIDLIELAGLWIGAGDWAALQRTLERLDQHLSERFADDEAFAQRFRDLSQLAVQTRSTEEIRRAYRRATVG
jgi:hypothetical protein